MKTKLALKRRSIRVLTPRELDGVGGGLVTDPANPPPSGQGSYYGPTTIPLFRPL
jgi:hypothetical protein